MFRFASTIFLSAVLLFLVQPMIGKAILPWFGGGASVWTACLLFFQSALLAGYCYAHLLCRWLPRRAQGLVHLAALLASLALLPLAPRPEAWLPSGTANPTWVILALLVVNLGVPFVLLSATAPLLQRWFSRTFPRRVPYRLYALSNAGSLAALAAYPFVVEPLMGLNRQMAAWSWGFAALVALGGWCALRFALAPATSSTPAEGGDVPDTMAEGSRPRAASVALWLVLAATGAAMLMATTNQLCQEVAVVPLLWVLPLSIYLLTFIICFDNARWYVRRWFASLLAVSAVLACALLYAGPRAPLWAQVAGYSLVLAACAMTCHGELYRLRPAPRYLTLFYLLVAGGGALGGSFVAVAAPRLFPGYWEYHLALLATCLLLSVTSYRDGAWHMRRTRTLWRGLAVGQVALAVVLANEALHVEAVETRRSFYGVLRVVRGEDEQGPYTRLVHGRIIHGMQYQQADKRRWPTLVFGPQSAVALAMRHHPRRGDGPARRPLRVGIVGLGAGTIAVYAEPGDVLRYYEINPDVVQLARRHFTFLQDSPAEVSVVLGDARASLERELRAGSQRYDILVVDAFTNDAIPIHLLTRQCGAVYLEHLKDDGLLLMHISNRFVDLGPVARGLAGEFGLRAAQLRAPGNAPGTIRARWVVLTRNRQFLEHPAVRRAIAPWAADAPPPLLWTDDHAGLLQVLQD